MQKNSTTLNFTRATLDYITAESNSLGLKNSPYVESVIMTHAFTNGYRPNIDELNNLRNSFLVNGSSNMTGDFRDQISTFDPNGQTAIIAFFYRLNLIKKLWISTTRMANLFKDQELCYFALGKIGRSQQLVNDYLKSYSLNTVTIGNTSAPDNEYLFFSNYQQFRVRKAYPLFPTLLKELSLPSGTEVIRVHYSQLSVMADAIEAI